MAGPARRNPFGLHALLQRGENLVAPLGIAAVIVVALCTGGVAWWFIHNHEESARNRRVEQVRAVAEVLSQSAAIMMARNEVSSLRHIVVQSSLAYHLEVCRVVLSDGTVLADADPSRITAPSLPTPEAWSKTQPGQPKEVRHGNMIDVDVPFNVPGRGEAVIQVTAEIDQGSHPSLRALGGFGLVGAAGIGATLLVYRHTRARVHRLSVIRDALLHAADDGAAASGGAALTVSDEYGPEAKAWNKVLAENQSLRQQLLGKQAQALVEHRGHRAGDLQSACDLLWQGLLLVDDKLRVRYANGAAATFLRTERQKLLGVEVSGIGLSPQVLAMVQNTATGAPGNSRAPGRRSIEVAQQPAGAANQDASGKTTEAATAGGGATSGGGSSSGSTSGGSGSTSAGGVLRFTVRPVRHERSVGALVIVEDVTQQRVADAARNSFIAQATHELRMPLTNMRLYLETALNEGENDAKLRAQCLNVINQESQRLERMVGDMLSVAEIEAGSLQIEHDDCRLDALFKELEADYKAQATEKHVALAFNLPPKLPVIQADRGKFVLALHNLIGNAVKYTPTGGSVTVQVDVAPRLLTVEVRDTGIGIAPRDLEHIFEKFYRAKDKRVAEVAGSGLGLALAREIVRLHGGDITVESQLDQGSTFTLTLPITVEEM